MRFAGARLKTVLYFTNTMTSDIVSGRDFSQRRNACVTFLAIVHATFGETALIRGINGRRKFSLELDAFLACIGFRNENGRQKRPCVRVQRLVEQLLRGCFLQRLAQVHDNNVVGNMVNNTQIMSN